MKGATYPDQWVVRGNHHDGWVFGASDPLSGNVAMMSETKAMGALAQAGLAARRARSSTPAGTARSRACSARPNGPKRMPTNSSARRVIYINTDGNGRGFLGAEGSHDFQHLVNQVAGRRDRSRDRRRASPSALRAAIRVGAYRRRPAPTRRDARRRRRAAATCRSARSAQARTIRPISSISACPRSISAMAARMRAAASIIRSTTASITSRRSTIPGSNMARRCRRRSAGWCCASPMPTRRRCASAISPTPSPPI